MRVLLVNTPKLRRDTFPPYALGLLNAFLRDRGIECEIFDLDIVTKHQSARNPDAPVDVDYLQRSQSSLAPFLRDEIKDPKLEQYIDRLIEMLSIRADDLVAFNAHDGELYFALALARAAKEKTGCLTAIGGSHIQRTSFSRLTSIIHALSVDYVDYFIRGAGYQFLLELVQGGRSTIERKTPELVDVWSRGDAYASQWDYEVPLYNRDHLNLYRIRMGDIAKFYPATNPLLVQRLANIPELVSAEPVLVLPLRFHRGCNNNCAFCIVREQKPYIHEEDQVIENIRKQSELYGCRDFYFLNNNFIMNQKSARRLLRRLEDELDIRWNDSCAINGLDRSLVESMSAAGCIQLLFGLETGSESLLARYAKNSGYHSLSSYSDCFRQCHENNIWVNVDLIAGLPHETAEDLRKTQEFLAANAEYIDGSFVNKFILTDKTPMYKRPEKYGIRLRDTQYNPGQGGASPNFYYRTNPFDEIGGLKWEEKERQIQISNLVLNAHIAQSFPYQTYIHHIIFMLYSVLGTKAAIRSALGHAPAELART